MLKTAHNESPIDFKALCNALPHGIICQDEGGKIIAANEKAADMLGINLEWLFSSPNAKFWGKHTHRENDSAHLCAKTHPVFIALNSDQQTQTHKLVVKPPNSPEKWLSVNTSRYQNPDKVSCIILCSLSDVTAPVIQNKVAEANLYKLAAIERINRISLGASSLDEMLQTILEEVLSIFCCDRASLLYPCDPDALTVKPLMEKNRPGWPGAFTLNDEIPVTSDIRKVFQQCLLTGTPTPIDINTGDQNPSETNHQYGIRSQMIMGLKPKIGLPWALVIHHCERPHVYTEDEIWLFEELGHRITIALSGMLSLRNLRESEARFRTLVENAPEAIFVLDAQTKHIIDTNKNTCDLFKMRRNELFDIDFLKLSPINQQNGQTSRYLAEEYIHQAWAGKQPVFEWTYITSEGEHINCETKLVRLPSQERTLIRGSIIDIRERQRSEEHMRKLSRALQQTADSILITDKHGFIEYVNPAFEKTTGYKCKEIIGQTPALLKSNKHDRSYYEELWDTITAGKVFSDVITNRKKNGSYYHEEKKITPLKDDNNNITHFIATGRDITERIHTQERLHYLAHHDVLTDLPNRSGFSERLHTETSRALRNNKKVAVLFADLDRFKIINDTLGHDVGDQVLKTAADRLANSLRSSDTVARLGGDEFAIILTDITSTNKIAKIASKILQEISKPMYIDEQELFISSSIGITIFPDDSHDVSVLTKHSDIAMYRAKKQGRNNYQFFSEEMSTKAAKRLTLETNLRRALERGELRLYYQPQLDILSNKIIGVEALLRWEHPEQGLTPPNEFIHILEETGLIVQVGEWVTRTACTQLKAWQNAGYNIRMAVNVSSRQFNDSLLEQRIYNIIKESGISPSNIGLELTESLLMRNPGHTELALKHLSDMGINLSIDDFGVGYSSLNYLRRFPLNTLKIDRSFVSDITTDSDDAAIIITILAMAKTLKMSVIAEGVETKEQLEFLQKFECNTYQGYLFSKPLPADDVTVLLEENYC
ncbi:EAL domain-containing protein [Pseudomonadota bacterium]